MSGHIMQVWTYIQLQEVIQQAINKHKTTCDRSATLLCLLIVVVPIVGSNY